MRFTRRLREATDLLTPWSRVITERLIGIQLVKKFPARFITAFTSARHLSLSWATTNQSMPSHPICEYPANIIIPSTPWSSKWSLSLRFHRQNPVYTCTLPHMCYTPRAPHSSRFFTRTILGEEHRSLSFSLCSILHSPVNLVPLRPKYCPQHPIVKHTQPMFLPQYERPSFTPIQSGNIIVL